MSRIEQLNKLWAADETDADVAYMLAQEHDKAGDADAALAWYDRCLSLDAGYHYAYFHKAKTLEAESRLDEARAVLREGLARANAAGDGKASGEIAAYLDELS
jgi:tetratricopeptide (TPR) repeat protein